MNHLKKLKEMFNAMPMALKLILGALIVLAIGVGIGSGNC